MNAALGPRAGHSAEELLADHRSILRELSEAAPDADVATDIVELIRRHTDALSVVAVLGGAEGTPRLVASRSTSPMLRAVLADRLLDTALVADLPVRTGLGPVAPVLDPVFRPLAVPLTAAGVGAVWCTPLHDAYAHHSGALALLFGTARPLGGHERLAIDLGSDLIAMLSERTAAGDLAALPLRVQERPDEEDRLEHILAAHVGRGGHVAVVLARIRQRVFDDEQLAGDEGDALMAMVVRRVRRALEPGTTLVRLDTDVFAAVIPRLEPHEARVHLTTRYADALAEPVAVMGRAVKVRVALGAALEGGDRTDATRLAREARLALARSRARDSRSDVDLTLDIAEPTTKWNRPPNISTRAHGDAWTVLYQPVVEIADRRAVAAEAVLCWNDPVRGPVPLDQLGEELRSPDEVRLQSGRLLNRALTDLSRLGDDALLPAGFELIVAAPDGPLDPAVVAGIADLLDRHRWPAARLVVTVSARGGSLSEHRGRRTVEELDALGARPALGDFGADAASVRLVEELPIRRVHIDQSLVGSIRADGSGSPLVAWALRMAAERGCPATAVGVDLDTQLRGLERLGCRLAQGHGVAPAVDAAGLRRLFDDQQNVTNS